MKRVLFLAIAFLLSITASAQTEHLKFKGIPIDGDFKAFAQKLVQKGFKQVEATPDGIILTGTFMATPGVTVVVYPDPSTKAVSAVAAMIEAGDNWSDIEEKYDNVIATYKEKYGEPSEQVKEFTTDVHNDDFFRKNALREGQCDYRTLWEPEGGRILISLVFFQFKYYVVCTYADEQNLKALRKSIIDDI